MKKLYRAMVELRDEEYGFELLVKNSEEQARYALYNMYSDWGIKEIHLLEEVRKVDGYEISITGS